MCLQDKKRRDGRNVYFVSRFKHPAPVSPLFFLDNMLSRVAKHTLENYPKGFKTYSLYKNFALAVTS